MLRSKGCKIHPVFNFASCRSLLCKKNDSERLKGPVPVAARSKAWVCSRSPAEIVGSNPAGGMDVYLL